MKITIECTEEEKKLLKDECSKTVCKECVFDKLDNCPHTKNAEWIIKK